MALFAARRTGWPGSTLILRVLPGDEVMAGPGCRRASAVQMGPLLALVFHDTF
jgi:hypothetical protein